MVLNYITNGFSKQVLFAFLYVFENEQKKSKIDTRNEIKNISNQQKKGITYVIIVLQI